MSHTTGTGSSVVKTSAASLGAELTAVCLECLQELIDKMPGIIAAGVFTQEGREIACVTDDPTLRESLWHITRSMDALGEETAHEALLKSCQHVIVACEYGNVVMLPITGIGRRRLMISVIADDQALIGSLLVACKQFASNCKTCAHRA